MTGIGPRGGDGGVRLHSYFRSSASWRVRIALAWKGIDYDYVPVHLVRGGGEQHSEAYRALNPLRSVPSLEIDGVVLTESLAILDYLEQTRPDPPLFPRTPVQRARALQLAEVVNSGIQPVQNLRVLQKLGSDWNADDSQRAAWARHWIGLGLTALEELLQRYSGTYSVGDDVSVADVCLVPQLYNARRFGVDLEPFVHIRRVESALRTLPAFQAAVPGKQPDCPPELRE